MDNSLAEAFRISSVAVPGEIVAATLGVSLVLVLLLLCGVGSYFKRLIFPAEVILTAEQSRRLGLPRQQAPGLFSHLLVLVYLLALGGVGYVGKTIWDNGVALKQNPPHLAPTNEPGRIQDLLTGKETPGADGTLSVSAQDLNAFFQNHLRLEPDQNSSPVDSLALVRTGISASDQGDYLVLSERLVFFNFPLAIEYLIPGNRTGDNALKIKANGIPLRGYIAAYLANRITSQLQTAFRPAPIFSKYKFVGVCENGLAFQRIAR